MAKFTFDSDIRNSDKLNQTRESRSEPETDSHYPNDSEAKKESRQRNAARLRAHAANIEIPLLINQSLLLGVGLCAEYASQVDLKAPGALKSLFVYSLHNGVKSFVGSYYRSLDDKQKIFTVPELTKVILNYIGEEKFDETLENFHYTFTRYHINKVMTGEEIIQLESIVTDIVEKYQANGSLVSEAWCCKLNTEAMLRLSNLEPLAAALKVSLAGITKCISAAIPEAIFEYYCEKRGKDYPPRLIIDNINAVVERTKPDKKQFEMLREKLAQENGVKPNYGELGMSHTSFINLYFHGKENMLRSLMSIGDTLYSSYEYKGTKRTATRKKSVLLESKKNKQFIEYIESHRFSGRDLLDYVVSGLLRYLNVDIPLSVYKYAADELCDDGMLDIEVRDSVNAVISSTENGSYRGLTGVAGREKYLEAGNTKFNRKVKAEIGI